MKASSFRLLMLVTTKLVGGTGFLVRTLQYQAGWQRAYLHRPERPDPIIRYRRLVNDGLTDLE